MAIAGLLAGEGQFAIRARTDDCRITSRIGQMDLPAERSSPIVFLRPLQRFFHRRALTQEVFPVLDRRQFWMAVQPRRTYRVAVISEAFLIDAALRKKVIEPKEDAAVFLRAAGRHDPVISFGVDGIFVIAK